MGQCCISCKSCLTCSMSVDNFREVVSNENYDEFVEMLKSNPSLVNAVSRSGASNYMWQEPLLCHCIWNAHVATTTRHDDDTSSETTQPLMMTADTCVKYRMAEHVLKEYGDELDKDARMIEHEFGNGTALHIAAIHSSVPFIKLLLKHKFSSMVRNNRGRTPFEELVYRVSHKFDMYNYRANANEIKIAADALCDGIVEYLAEADDLDEDRSKFVDEDGMGPLHHCAHGCCVAAIGLLLQAGFSPTQKNNKGETPVMYLLRANHSPNLGRIDDAVRLLYDAEKYNSEEEKAAAVEEYKQGYIDRFIKVSSL